MRYLLEMKWNGNLHQLTSNIIEYLFVEDPIFPGCFAVFNLFHIVSKFVQSSFLCSPLC